MFLTCPVISLECLHNIYCKLATSYDLISVQHQNHVRYEMLSTVGVTVFQYIHFEGIL